MACKCNHTIFILLLLASFTAMFSRFKNVATCINSIIPFYGCILFHCMAIPHFIYPVDHHLSCFHFLYFRLFLTAVVLKLLYIRLTISILKTNAQAISLMRSKSLGVGPRHHYFFKVLRGVQWAVRFESQCPRAAVRSVFSTRDGFCGRQFFHKRR